MNRLNRHHAVCAWSVHFADSIVLLFNSLTREEVEMHHTAVHVAGV